MRALTEYFPSARRPGGVLRDTWKMPAGMPAGISLSVEEYLRDIGLAVTLADGDADGCVGP